MRLRPLALLSSSSVASSCRFGLLESKLSRYFDRPLVCSESVLTSIGGIREYDDRGVCRGVDGTELVRSVVTVDDEEVADPEAGLCCCNSQDEWLTLLLFVLPVG